MAQYLPGGPTVPNRSSEVARICWWLELVGSVAVHLFLASVSFARSDVRSPTNQSSRTLSDCEVLEAVRSVVREASDSDLARARERLAIEQTNPSSLPQLSALWRALPGAEDAERELEVLVSIPLGTFGSRQAKDQQALGRLNKSMDLRVGHASLLRDALALYYELVEITLALSRFTQVRNLWARTNVFVDRLPANGPERNLLHVTLSLEQDRLDDEIEALELRRALIARKSGDLLGLDRAVLQDATMVTSTLQMNRGVEPRTFRSVRANGPQLWRSALSGVQLQTGVTTVWTPGSARWGYYLGMSYAPVSRSVFRSLQTQTRVTQLEQQEVLDDYQSRRKVLEGQRRELLLAKAQLVQAQRANEASRAKERRVLDQEPSEITLTHLTNRIDLIRSVHRRDVRELRLFRRASSWEVQVLESHAVVSGLNSIVCGK